MIRYFPLIFMVLLGLLLWGCSASKHENTAYDETKQKNPISEPERIIDQLETPWAIDKYEDIIFISERAGTMAIIENNKLKRQKVNLEETLSKQPEAGLLGFVLAPDFSDSKQAYAYYTYEKNEMDFNRIVLLEHSNNQWTEKKVLLDKIPSDTYHHGGRLKIGPDNKLYATTGDATNPDLSQDTSALNGKILRLNLDGSIPDDNPYQDSYVFTYGHRNAQGMVWDDEGIMYASEHGDQANDEINRIEAKMNYGWPEIEGSDQQKGMESPLYTSGKSKTWAPSGIALKDKKLYVATLRGESLLEFNLQTDEIKTIVGDLGRIRDVLIVEDKLYFITNNTDGRGNPDQNDDKLFKIDL